MKWFVFRTLEPAHCIGLRVAGEPHLFTRCGMQFRETIKRPAVRGDGKCEWCKRIVRRTCRK